MWRDERRFFTDAQRKEIYLRAEGVCESCGCRLNPGDWHADHIRPHSKGGLTELQNSQALCPSCNRAKSNKMNPLHFVPSGEKLHSWQVEFLDRFIASAKEQLANDIERKQAFVLNAFPGSGKTWAQLVAMSYFKAEGLIDFIFICVPSDKLRYDFAREAVRFGLNLYAKKNLKVDFDSYDGCVITYAQLSNDMNAAIIDLWCMSDRVFVSADEMHHLGMGRDKRWGRNFYKAFKHSAVRLMTSGTPFRSDGDKIPWVRYIGRSIDLSSPHAYSYGYGKGKWNPSQSALSDGVVRDVVFHPWDGEVTFSLEINGQPRIFCHKLSDNLDEIYADEFTPEMIGKLKSLRRKFCIECGSPAHPNGTQYVREQIRAAHDMLMGIRSGSHPHAGGLIVCQNRHHADAVARVVQTLTGSTPVVVHGEAGDHKRKLDAYQANTSASRTPWLVAVKMVTEGVDIKHLRVCVYLTVETAPMFWTQVLGRILRIDRGAPKDNQTAHFYQYDDGTDLVDGVSQSVRLRYFAETILEEKEFTLNTSICRRCGQDPCICEDLTGGRSCPVCRDADSPLYMGECPGLGVFPCPRPSPMVVQNLGATGEYRNQIYNGDWHDIKDLEFFKPLEVRWDKPAVACKHLVDLMPDQMREIVYRQLMEDRGNG